MAVGPAAGLATKLVILGVLLHNGLTTADNLRWPWLVGAAGLAMNTLVIGLNGGHMPQSVEAATAVWGGTRIDPARLQNVAAIGPHTLLPWLGDVLAEPSWIPRPNVVSPGDVVLSIGVAAWVFAATLRARRSEAVPAARIMSVIGTPIYGLRSRGRCCSD
jgi:hypothetical protein